MMRRKRVGRRARVKRKMRRGDMVVDVVEREGGRVQTVAAGCWRWVDMSFLASGFCKQARDGGRERERRGEKRGKTVSGSNERSLTSSHTYKQPRAR